MRALEEVRALARLPGPRGADGPPGKDGLGFDDMSVAYDGERSFTLQFKRGKELREFPFKVPLLIDRGVWREGRYERGDVVTFGGSAFIAQEDTDEKPETGKAWRLAVKSGRNGKPGVNGEKGDRGPEGRAGRDLTQVGPDGTKW
jgi:integrin beta 3